LQLAIVIVIVIVNKETVTKTTSF